MDPPFNEAYKALLAESGGGGSEGGGTVEECELPVVDLRRLSEGTAAEVEECKKEIARACEEWGFFQVVNHGISKRLLGEMRAKQMELFKQPFERKFMNFSAGSYRWGTPTATSLRQLSWSEAFHVSLSDILGSTALSDHLTLRYPKFQLTFFFPFSGIDFFFLLIFKISFCPICMHSNSIARDVHIHASLSFSNFFVQIWGRGGKKENCPFKFIWHKKGYGKN